METKEQDRNKIPKYTKSFRREVVAYALTTNRYQAAKYYCIPQGTVNNWLNKNRKDKMPLHDKAPNSPSTIPVIVSTSEKTPEIPKNTAKNPEIPKNTAKNPEIPKNTAKNPEIPAEMSKNTAKNVEFELESLISELQNEAETLKKALMIIRNRNIAKFSFLKN